MKKAFTYGALAVGALALLATVVLTQSVEAAGNKYSFIARVVVTDVDQGAKTFTADVKKVEGRGKDDMEGENIEFNIDSKAKILRNASGKDSAVTYKNIAIGQELGIKGVAKADDDDTFIVTFVRIHDRSFTVVGTMEEMNKTAKTMKIKLITSSYKPSTYKKGDDVTVTYTDDSTFYENNAERAIGDISADAQKVRLIGSVKDSNTWEASKIYNQYKGK